MLREAASLKNPMAMSICHRMHEAHSRILPSSFLLDHPMLQEEDQLHKLPSSEYFSTRVRRHEKLFQRSILDASFDLYSEGTLIANDLSFLDTDQIFNIIERDDINASSLVGKTSLADVPHLGSLLHMTARLGMLPLVKFLVKARADVNLHWEGCGTPVTSACRGGHQDIVHYILSNGGTAQRLSGNGPSPLHWMIMFEEDELLALFRVLKRHGGEINTCSNEPIEMREHSVRLIFSPLHFAVSVRYQKLVEILLHEKAATRGGILTPLDLAVSLGFPELTELLLRKEPSSGLKSPLLHLGLANALQTLLQHGSSARSQLQSTVDMVLKSKFSDINVTDPDGLTALASAISGCSCEIDLDQLEVLIGCGAELNIPERRVIHKLGDRNDGRGGRIMKLLLATGKINPSPSLLSHTCLYGDEDILQALLDFGIDVNAPAIEEGGSIGALHSSILLPGNYQIVKALLDHGADINAKFEQNLNVLELAAMSPIGDPDVIDLLIERGVELTSHTETTILHVAARLSSKINGAHILFHILRHDRVRALINVRSKDEHGATPLHFACVAGNLEAIKALLDYHAEISTTDKFNLVALVEVLGRSPERSPNWKEQDFDVATYQLTAERTLLMLLDKIGPSHRRTPLHIAASIGNYERVVELVESGADVWAGDSEKKTPLGHLHPDAGDPDSEESDPSLRRYLENCKKIFTCLQMKMVTVAAEASSFEDTKDVFFKIKEFPEEDDSPEQLEARYTELLEHKRRTLGENHPETLSAMSKLSDVYQLFENKYMESNDLELELLEKREAGLKKNDPELFESRSSRVRILFQQGNLEEARSYAESVLELALKNLGPDHHSTEIARLNLSLVDEAEGRVEEALEFQKELHQKLGFTEGIRFHHRDTLMIQFHIAHTYCALERWDDADAEVQYLLSVLEFINKEQYPDLFNSHLILAQMYQRYSRWADAQLIFEKLAENALVTRGKQSYYFTRALEVLVEHYKKQSKFKEASDNQLILVDMAKERHGVQHLETQERISELAKLYEDQSRLVEANLLRQQAVALSEEMFGPNDERTLKAKTALVNNLHKREKFDKAVQVAREVALGYKTIFGEGNEWTLSAENTLAILINLMDKCDEAVEIQEKVLQSLISVHGEVHDKVANALVNLGATHLRDSRIEGGEKLLKRALAINEELHGAESLEAAACLSFLGSAHVSADRREDSCKYHERALEIERKVRGSDKHETLYLMTWLGYDYIAIGELEKAITLQTEVYEGYRKLYGEENKDVLKAKFDLGESYHAVGDYPKAEKLYQQALEGRRKVLGDSHEDTLTSIEILGILYADMDRWEDVQPLSHEMLTRTLEKYGSDHSKTIEARKGLASTYHFLQLWPELEELQKEVVEISERILGADHPDTIESMDILSEACENQGNYEACEPLNIAVLAHRRRTFGSEHERTLNAIENLADNYVEIKKYKEAEELRLEAMEAHHKKAGEDSEPYLDMKSKLANVYWYQKRYPEAQVLEFEVVEARTRILGEDDTATLEAMESLARTYEKQEQWVKAEGLHLRVLASRQKVATSHLDPDVLTSMKRLEDVYSGLLRWSDAKGYAVVLLDAMKELAPKNDGRGVLSALSDLRRICYRLKEKDMVADLEKQVRLPFIVPRFHADYVL